MNDPRPPFLAALEVDPAAELDERTLRRAYARKLKQIDVEAEPERFQALREALDHGLLWLGWREQQRLAGAAREALLPEPVAAPAPEPLPELAPRPAPLPAPAPVPPAAPALPRGTGEIAEPAPAPAPTIARGPAPDAGDAPADAPRARPLPDTQHAAPPAEAPRARPLPEASPDAPPPDAPRVRPRVDASPETPPPDAPRARPRVDAQADAPPPADAPRARPRPGSPPDAPPPPPYVPRLARGAAPPVAPASPAPAPRVATPAAAPTPATEPKPPSADDIAGAVFARFQRRIGDGLLKDSEAGRALLLRFLADPGLVSIDARSSFEWRMARLLAGNWRPGNEHLFDPAVEIFGWDSDHARLKHFAQVGVLLTAAIRERGTVQAFTVAERAALDALLERIRRGAPPEPAQLADEVKQLQYLVERVPNWLRIVSPVGPVNERFETWSKRAPEAPRPPAPRPIQPQPKFMRKKTSPAAPIGIGLMILMLLAGLGQLGSTGSGSGPSAIPPPHRVAVTPADDADLARRQKDAEALLARIRQPGGSAH